MRHAHLTSRIFLRLAWRPSTRSNFWAQTMKSPIATLMSLPALVFAAWPKKIKYLHQCCRPVLVTIPSIHWWCAPSISIDSLIVLLLVVCICQQFEGIATWCNWGRVGASILSCPGAFLLQPISRNKQTRWLIPKIIWIGSSNIAPNFTIYWKLMCPCMMLPLW